MPFTLDGAKIRADARQRYTHAHWAQCKLISLQVSQALRVGTIGVLRYPRHATELCTPSLLLASPRLASPLLSSPLLSSMEKCTTYMRPESYPLPWKVILFLSPPRVSDLQVGRDGGRTQRSQLSRGDVAHPDQPVPSDDRALYAPQGALLEAPRDEAHVEQPVVYRQTACRAARPSVKGTRGKGHHTKRHRSTPDEDGRPFGEQSRRGQRGGG